MKVTNAPPEYEIVAPNEALLSWKNDRVTIQIKDIVSRELMASSIRMAEGETLGGNIVQDTARAVGYVESLKFVEDLLRLDFVVSKTEDEDDREGKENS